jgi:hypothetical protein
MKIDSSVEMGREAGCPFCAAQVEGRPSLGQRIMILNGYRAGMMGTVSSVDLDARFRPGAFLIKADRDNPHIEQIVNPDLDLFTTHPPEELLTKWIPPLTMGSAAALHDVVLRVCGRFAELGSDEWHRGAFYALIDHCWRERLPLSEQEVWAILDAHGMQKNLQKDARRSYVEGMELLVYTHGRKPIKKKRVEPLSVPRANK